MKVVSLSSGRSLPHPAMAVSMKNVDPAFHGVGHKAYPQFRCL